MWYTIYASNKRGQMKKLDLTNFQDLSYLMDELTETQTKKVFFLISKKSEKAITINLFRLETEGILKETPWVASIIEKNVISFECCNHILGKWLIEKFNQNFLATIQEKKIAYYFEHYDDFILFFTFFDKYFMENDITPFDLESVVYFVFNKEGFIELIANRAGLLIE